MRCAVYGAVRCGDSQPQYRKRTRTCRGWTLTQCSEWLRHSIRLHGTARVVQISELRKDEVDVLGAAHAVATCTKKYDQLGIEFSEQLQAVLT